MTKTGLFSPVFLSCMTSRLVIFPEQGGSVRLQKFATFDNAWIFHLSNCFFVLKNSIPKQ
jgi:hypothetical protein